MGDGSRRRRIWVDADACPRPVKEILYRAAQRLSVELVLVANQSLDVPRSPYIRSVRVGAGFDAADDHIVERVAAGDLVVSADIPLAAEVIARGADVLSPRGDRYDRDNIRERLSMRDFMSGLRGAGVETGGQSTFGKADRARFANALDRWSAAMGVSRAGGIAVPPD